MLILAILGIVVSAFVGFFCTMWFFDRNFEEKHRAFCLHRSALRLLVLVLGLGFLALAVYLSVQNAQAHLGNVKRPPSELPLTSGASQSIANG